VASGEGQGERDWGLGAAAVMGRGSGFAVPVFIHMYTSLAGRWVVSIGKSGPRGGILGGKDEN
jgi:hypothetical protein